MSLLQTIRQVRGAWHTILFVAMVKLLCCAGCRLPEVRGDETPAARKVQQYQSANFLIHTDLAEEDAQELLERLENMLTLISRYWGAPSRKKIVCYIVDDTSNWPAGSLSPEALATVSNGGITNAAGVKRGRVTDMTAVVYASTKFGTPQHEAVHAYCYQAFGTTGPTWYAEGMAEMGNYWVEGDESVNCPDYVVEFLKSSPRPTLQQITDPDHRTGDGWKNYAWRWALCHFLSHNPNYAERFRVLGVSLLSNRGGTIERAWPSQMDELEFEFQFFLDHLETGLEAKRCRWDWKARFREASSKAVRCKVDAARGWQPSLIKGTEGQKLRLTAEGQWTTDVNEPPFSGRGSPVTGKGRILGCVKNEKGLSDEFVIIPDRSFSLPAEGDLYLRCEDEWTSLNDNDGELAISVSAEIAE
ncbi:MAG: hypothetical protein JNM43_14545 [Planctomycetaceae bacterium]|nr:hypothetical protein [Planctomycetaceae bacterium]